MRIAMTCLLLVHGVAHLPGFVVPWRLVTSPDLPYRTTLFGGAIDLGDTGIRCVGLLWAAIAIGFAYVALLHWTGADMFRVAALAAVGISAVLCLAAWPEARIGLAVNAGLAVALLVR